MKKIVTLFALCFIAVANIKAQYVTIPNANFRTFLETKYPSCFNAAHQMDTTCSAVLNEQTMNLNMIYCTSIEGIKYFKNLITLVCDYNYLNSLPQLPSTLTYLNCSTNQLTTLSNLPDGLITLLCINNQLATLPNLPSTLSVLRCDGNILTVWPNLPNTLRVLTCMDNQLTTLPNLPSTLNELNCSDNKLMSLPVLPNSLHILESYQNPTYTLPPLPDSLIRLNCSVACLPKLPSTLQYLSNNFGYGVLCIPNRVPNLQYLVNGNYTYITPVPFCNPTNNVHQCLSSPNVVGRVFTDNNSNGVKDAKEFYRPFVKSVSSSGDVAFSNLKGEFAFNFDSIGSYSFKTIAPKYYKAVPDSNGFSFTAYNAYLTVPDIALQPTVLIDSLAIIVTPLNSRARPGFRFPYQLAYANLGTTNLNTTISFTYDTSRLKYDSSSVAIVSNTNNTITILADSLVAAEGRYATLYFTVKPSAIIGDTLFTVANAVSGATAVSSTNTTIIRGSFDPNDKTATPQLTTTQVANGDWIEYTIRFQNTGNDTAFNVVLADTLSSFLQKENFNVISTSHPSKVTRKANSNIVYFEFLNINLPDSNTNHSGSQGWVTFKVKPVVGVTAGTNIDNKASIYFDYNQPIQTNVARTLIVTPPLPVKLLSYALRLTQTDKKSVENIWSTENEINTSHFNIQRSIDGINFKVVGQVAAKGSSSYSFTDPLTINNLPSTIFYRLQIVDKDGRIEYSPIKEIRINQLTNKLINIYPNPAKDMVIIECANAKEVMIIDYLGRTIKQFNSPTERQTINTKPLLKCVYVVKAILNNGDIRTERLIVE